MRSRVLAIVVAVLLLLIALGVVISRSGNSTHTPARLPIVAGASGESATLGVAPVDSPALSPYGGVVYKASPNLPALNGSARAYKVAPADAGAGRRLADAFGLQDQVQSADFTFTDGDAQLTVAPAGVGFWGYSRSSTGEGVSSSGVVEACPANADCPAPPTTIPQHPADLPSQDDAKAAALAVLQRAGIDTNHAVVVVDDAITQWVVRVDPTIDGVPTEGFGSAVTIGERGVIEYASGTLGTPEAADEYPLMGTGLAIERLNRGEGFVGPRPMFAQDTPLAESSTSANANAGSVPANAGPNKGSAPPSGGPTEPAPLPPCDGTGAPTTFPCGSSPDAPVPNTLAPPPPQEITLTGVEQILLFATSYDGNEDWLVPGYRFRSDQGVGPSVLAIDNRFLTPPDQVIEGKNSASAEPLPAPAPASDGGR